jgi:hypothetical protein
VTHGISTAGAGRFLAAAGAVADATDEQRKALRKSIARAHREVVGECHHDGKMAS